MGFLPRPAEWGPHGKAELPESEHDLKVADCEALADALQA